MFIKLFYFKYYKKVMSLVITANEINKSTDEDGVHQAPYQYRNYMKQTMTLPEDCEVAVQSVKYDRDDTLTIRPGDTWFQSYNINLKGLDDGRTEDDTTGKPIRCTFDVDFSENISLENMVEEFTLAQRKGFTHPDIYGISDGKDITPITKAYEDSNNIFGGFTLRTTNSTTAEDLNTRSNMVNFTKIYLDDDPTLTYTSGTNTFTAPDVPGASPKIDNVVQLTDLPMSHYKGNLRWDIGGMCKDTTNYSVDSAGIFGLARSVKRDRDDPEPYQAPPYFDESITNARTPVEATGGGLHATQTQFYDYAIAFTQTEDGSDDYYLQVICSGVATDDDGNKKIVNQEIEYWGWTDPYPSISPAFTERFNMTTNQVSDGEGGTTPINQFLIRIEGEQVLFYYHRGPLSTSNNPLDDVGSGSAWILFCGYSMGQGYYNATYIKNIPNPINQCKWMMYPKVYISNDDIDLGGGSTKKGSLQITAYSGRIAQGDAEQYGYFDTDTDWWARMWEEETIEECEDIELNRPKFNDLTRTDNFYEQLATISTSAVSTYKFIYILSEDTEGYYKNTQSANMDRFLGFEGVSILEPTSFGTSYNSNRGYKYDSEVVPPLISDQSLFIRLDNFTQKTSNGAVARPSKILLHVPRFDNSARAHGDGLFYEPHNLVYVKLNNPNPVVINEFDISICNVGEILAKDLQGQTIVCLHFRQSPTIKLKDRDEPQFIQ
jgi:hypothetical protein|tara:strand:+ start:6739 stop:8892 length:2154 start_codon:yes stop_codon:yes gene_type:complete